MSDVEPQLSGTAPPSPAPSADTATPERVEEPSVDVEPQELGDTPLEGLDVDRAGDVAVGGDRDSLVEREERADDAGDAGAVSPELASHGPPQFTSGEKVASLVERLMNGPPPDDAKTRVALRALKWAKRVGMVDPIVALFPPIDDAEAWDTWLALGVGIALNLVSDGVGVDQAQARVAGAQVLQAFFYGGDE